MRALLEWSTPAGRENEENYTIRYRFALNGEWNVTYQDTSIVEIDVVAKTTAQNNTTERGYVLEGLDPARNYWVEVGIDVTEAGVTTTHFSNPVLVSLVNRFRVWWETDLGSLTPEEDITPYLKTNIARIFTYVNTNKDDASSQCYLNGGDINCPPRTLTSIGASPGGKHTIFGVATTGSRVVNGPIYAVTPKWVIRWVAAFGEPYEKYLAGDGAPPRPASLLPGVSAQSNNKGKAQVTWDELLGVSSAAAYKIRHRERGTDAWTTATVSNAAERKHVLEGLTHQKLYDVQVGACVHTCGPSDEYVLWSESRPMLGLVEGARAWWTQRTPQLNRTLDRIFVAVQSNRPVTQGVCKITEDDGAPAEVNCPGNLASIDVSRAGKYLVEATLTTTEIETPATQTDPAVYKKIGPPARRFHKGYDGAGEINYASVSAGDGKIAVSWSGNYTGIGHTFTKGGKTYKVKEHDADLIIYQEASVGGDYWKQVRVEPSNNGYYEITESPYRFGRLH